MYALRLSNQHLDHIDLCVICGDGLTTPETHIRITNVYVGEINGQTVHGQITQLTQVEECDGQACQRRLIEARVMILGPELEQKVAQTIFAYRREQEKKTTYRIVDGPAREDLFLALRLNHEGRTVAFVLEGGKTVLLSITGIMIGLTQRGDGGYAWSFRAHDKHLTLGHLNLLGHYRTDRRTGHIQLDH